MSHSNKTIVIKKIDAVPTGHAPMEKNKYVPGTQNNIKEKKSIPVEYEVEGILLAPMKIGESVIVMRTKRNGITANGLFRTTGVTELTDTTFKTKNSVYIYHYL